MKSAKNIKKILAGTLALAVCALSGCSGNPDSKEDPLAGYAVDALLPFGTRAPEAAVTATPSPTPSPTDIISVTQGWQNDDAPQVTAAPAPTKTYVTYEFQRLEQGDQGEDVQRLQARLIELGYLSGSADGKFGANTKSAVKLFQKALGLSQTGVATVSLQEKLFISSAPSYAPLAATSAPSDQTSQYMPLVRGDTGEGVKSLQTRLIQLGYLTGSADGVFGGNTEKAVKAFQAALGLSQTGVASASLQSQLYSSGAPYAPAQATKAPTQAPTKAPTKAPQTDEYQQLEPGDTGEAVVLMQKRLRELGYFSGNATGNYYKETTAAVQRFQAALGLSQTGIASSSLLSRLYSSSAPAYSAADSSPTDSGGGYTALQRGSKGTEVQNLQKRLIALGYMNSTADGDYGARTEAAVKLFQQTVGYEQTGAAGIGLQNLLFSDSAPAYKSAATAAPTKAPASSAYRQLEPGNTGDQVKQLQTRLKELGFFSGLIGGNYLTKTTDAVKLFQAAIGHEQTGVATSAMQEVLYSSSAPDYESVESDYVNLEKPDSGIQVRNLQQRLISLGWLSGYADGEYGSNTEKAVRAFQAAAGLEQTGKASPKTQETLYSSSAPYAPKATAAPTKAPATTAPTEAPVQNAPYTTLKSGSSGEAVKDVQRRLQELGYFDGNIGGNYLTKTETAVKLFQAALGRTADGVANSDLQSLLFSSSAPAYDGSAYIELKNGLTGPAVKRLQQRLIQLGWLSGTADGDFGGGTEKAVKRFQAAMNQSETGVASPSLQAQLFSSSAPAYSEGGGSSDSGSSGSSASGYQRLSYGNTGDAVKALQRRLKELGYFDGEIGGNYLKKTQAAVTLFQQIAGWTADGIATPELQELIFSASAPVYGQTAAPDQLIVLQGGDSGTQVKQLQQRLIQLGWLSGEADGDFGSNTETALMSFQYRMGLEVDGIAGIEVQELLYAANAPVYVQYVDLAPGTQGDEVLAIQLRLIELGYLEDAAVNTDGIYGEGLTNALRQLQLASGDPAELADGVATIELQTFLFSENALRYALLP